MGTWFDAYHLSRPPLVKDEFDSVGADISPLRNRLADGLLILGLIVGSIVAMATLDAGEPLTGVALGAGLALTGGAGGQLACYAPEAREAWKQGKRGWVTAFAVMTVTGVALFAWGFSAY